MQRYFLVVATTLCLACTNVTTIGAPPRIPGPIGWAIEAMWNTTTRFDDRSETDDEREMRETREARYAQEASRRRAENDCMQWYVDRALASNGTTAPLVAAEDQRCAVLVGSP